MRSAGVTPSTWDPERPDAYEGWLAGFRWRERRPLTDPEIAGLRPDRDYLLWEAQNWRIVGWILLGFGVFLALGIKPVSSGFLFLFIFSALSGATLYGYQRLTYPPRIKEVDAHLADGRVDVFELVIPSDNPFLSGTKQLHFSPATGKNLAARADRAIRDSRPIWMPRVEPGSRIRSLTDEEKLTVKSWGYRAEISATAIGVCILVTASLLADIFLHPGRLDRTIPIVGWANLLLTNAILSSGLRSRLTLSRTLRRNPSTEPAVRKEVPFERLVGTEIPWTINGLPAAWRRQPPSAFDHGNPITLSWEKYQTS